MYMEMVDMVITKSWFSGPKSRSANNSLQQPDFVKSSLVQLDSAVATARRAEQPFKICLSDLQRDFQFSAYRTHLIDCGSQFLRICCMNHPKWSNMNQKMASEYRSSYSCNLWWFPCILQALCRQVYARMVSSQKKHVPRSFGHVLL